MSSLTIEEKSDQKDRNAICIALVDVQDIYAYREIIRLTGQYNSANIVLFG